MIPPVDNWDKIMVVRETIGIKIVTILKPTWYMPSQVKLNGCDGNDCDKNCDNFDANLVHAQAKLCHRRFEHLSHPDRDCHDNWVIVINYIIHMVIMTLIMIKMINMAIDCHDNMLCGVIVRHNLSAD